MTVKTVLASSWPLWQPGHCLLPSTPPPCSCTRRCMRSLSWQQGFGILRKMLRAT